jgi:hypothetical protein
MHESEGFCLKLKQYCWTLTQSFECEVFISIVILINSVVLGSEHYMQP